MRTFVGLIAGLAVSVVWAQVDAPQVGWDALLRASLLAASLPVVASLVAVAIWALLRYRRNRRGGRSQAAWDGWSLGHMPWVNAALVLLTAWGLTAWATYQTSQRLTHDAWLRYQFEIDRVEAGLQRQFDALMPSLRAMRAAAAVGVRFDNPALNRWVTAQSLDLEFPGVLGVGMAPLRAERAATGATVTARSIHFHPEPLQSNVVALPWQSDALHETVVRAVQHGRPALSPAISFEGDGQVVLLALPVYAQDETPPTQERRMAQVTAVAFALIRVGDFLAGVDAASNGLVAIELHDGIDVASARLLYHSASLTDAEAVPMFDDSRNVLIGQRFFQVRVVSTPEFERGVEVRDVNSIAFLGSALGVLLSSLAWLLLVGRARALARASALSSDVERLALVVQRTSNAVLITDAQERITWANDGFCRISGYSVDEVVGRRPSEFLLSPRTSAQSQALVRDAIEQGRPCRARVVNVGKSGREYWLDMELQPQHDAQGRLQGFMSIEQDVTEQVLAEQALQRERERAEGILLGSNVGTWQANLLTGEVLVNEQWARMLGFELTEIGKDLTAFWESRVRPEDLVRVNILLDACRNGEAQRYDTDVRVRSKGGQWLWISSRAVVMSHDVHGRAEWIAGIHMDITEQRHTEDGLRDTEAFLYRSGRAAGVGAWEIDLRTGIIKWSDQTCEMHGVERGYQPSLEELLSYYDEEGRAQLSQAMTLAPQTLMGWDLTLPFTNREGDSLWVRNVGEVEFDDSGPVRLVGAFQDVTQIKNAQLEIQRTGAMLQSVLDSAVQVAIIGTNLAREITVFNKGAEHMLGYGAEEVLHTETTSKFFAPEQLDAIRELLTIELGTEPNAAQVFAYVVTHPELSEWTFVRKDETRLTVSFLISTMYDAAGQPVGYLGIASDITEQKAQEARLREAKVQAEAASVAKSQFLANMSHEIRTPMNAILGMLRLLQNTPLNAQQSDYTRKTNGAAKSLLGLLNDILDFSKVEAGKLQLDPYPFVLEELLSDMSVILSSNLGAKAVDLVFDIDPRLPARMVGDALRIKQVLINLGGNAIKFTEHGRVTLVWQLVGIQGNRVRSHIEVQDTGIGIAPEHQARIFDGFSQAEASTTRKYGGTGLGLAISQRMIRLLGSELRLHSVPGAGSCFSFDLDLPTGDALDDEGLASDASLLCVLVVDDDPVSQAAIVQAARANGWRTETANSAADARAQVLASLREQAHGFDVVLVDERMPEVDGWQLLVQLQGDRAGRSDWPRCVLVGGRGQDAVDPVQQARSAGFDAYAVKPLTAGMLALAVNAARRAFTDTGVPTAVQQSPSGARLAGLRLLVVEDNPINQQVARELLVSEGASVQLADNGQIGVDALRAAPDGFDVVLMDLQMPVLDGLSAARTVRGELGLTDLPIIAMTANAMASDREDCMQAGMNDHVGKPFDLNDLVHTLLRYSGRGGASSASAHHGASEVAIGTDRAPKALGKPTEDWVDVAGAVERMGGHHDLYLMTLDAYVEEALGVVEQVQQELAQGAIDAATRQAHSFKGLSATVGARRLQQLALAVETALKRGDDDVERNRCIDALAVGIEQHEPILRAILAQQSVGDDGNGAPLRQNVND